MTIESRSYNWNTIAWELDKIGINIEDEALADIKESKQAPIDRLFMRIERYSKIIAGPDFLKFENLEADDLDEGLDDDFIIRKDTELSDDGFESPDLLSAKSFTDYNVADLEDKEESCPVRITERGTEESASGGQQFELP